MSIHLIYWTSCEFHLLPYYGPKARLLPGWCRTGNVSGLGAAGGITLTHFTDKYTKAKKF